MAIIRRYDEIICQKVDKTKFYEFEYNFGKTLQQIQTEISLVKQLN